MPYPRLLKLSPKIEQNLINYISTSLQVHKSEKGAFIDDLIALQTDYWAKSPTGERTFPFKGAANIIIPLGAIAFESIHAKNFNKLKGLHQTVSAKPINKDFADIAPSIERYLQLELVHGIKFFNKLEPAIIEIEKFGTGVAKASYCNLVKYGISTIAGKEELIPVTIKRGAQVDTVPLSRFLMPFTSKDPQMSPWVGEELSMTENEIKMHEESGLFIKGTYDKIKAHFSTNNPESGSGDKFLEAQEKKSNMQPETFDRITIDELWLGYAIHDDGTDPVTGATSESQLIEIVCHYHPLSQTLMSVRYNWKKDLRRPYCIGVYMPIEHRWHGIGVLKQGEQFQKEITTQHRQRLDNATLANMRMLKVSRMSGYGPNEPVFPGKTWYLYDMEHVDTLQMGEIYPSAYNNENQSLIYWQQRTTINELSLGMPDAGTPGTASDVLTRMKEGNLRSDYIFGNITDFANEVLTDFLVETQTWGPRRVEYYDEVDGAAIQKFFDLPEDSIRNGIALNIRLANAQENKLLDRSTWTQLAGIKAQYWDGMIKLSQLLQDQQLTKAITLKALISATEVMKQIDESFDVRNIDRVIFSEILRYGSNSVPQNSGTGGGTIPPNQNGLLAPTEGTPPLATSGGTQPPAIIQ